MGVKGLTSFVEHHPGLLISHKLCNTKVIVDGSSLYHTVYLDGKIERKYGGEYDVFASRIRQLFQFFFYCRIQPYVVFDGADSGDDRKLPTIIGRERDKITRSYKVSKGGDAHIIPLLVYDTFVLVLNELGIQHVTCDQEADREIALLANQYSCPVLALDSDYCIFNITFGYIPLNHVKFNFKMGPHRRPRSRFLQCKLYRVDHLLNSFTGLTVGNVALAASVLGNDFIDSGEFKSFLSKLKMPKTIQRYPIKFQKFIKLFNWLASLNDPENAEDKLMDFCSGNHQVEIREKVRLSVEGYTVQTCNFDLPEFFEKRQDFHAPTYLKGYNGTELPEWLVSKVRRAELPVFIMNIITLHRVILVCQVEHTSSPSAWTCSDKLREVLYGIILKDDLKAIGDKDPENEKVKFVHEYKRAGRVSVSFYTPPCLQLLTQSGSVPGLTELPRMGKHERIALFFESLGLEGSIFSSMSPTLVLYIACTMFWKRESNPKVADSHVKSLLVCMIYLLVQQSTGKETHASAKRSADGGYQVDLEASLSISSDQQLQMLKNTLQLFDTPPFHDEKRVIDCEIIHGFSQFQTCLLVAKYLNKVIGRPVLDANPERFFKGSFLYNLCRHLMLKPLPHLFLSEILVKGSPLHRCYQRLEELVLGNLSAD